MSTRPGAACVGQLELFFSDTPADRAAAKAICTTCPVRPDCLADALERYEPHGVWGGYDPDERMTIIRDIAQRSTAGFAFTLDPAPRRRHAS